MRFYRVEHCLKRYEISDSDYETIKIMGTLKLAEHYIFPNDEGFEEALQSWIDIYLGSLFDSQKFFASEVILSDTNLCTCDAKKAWDIQTQGFAVRKEK